MSIFELFQGVFSGKGSGEYPTIEPFEYLETLSFISDGRPFIRLEQKTKKTDRVTPLHQEVGYIRVVEGSELELVLVQPTGVVEVAKGIYSEEDASATMEFRSIQVIATPSAKPVAETLRTYRLASETLTFEFHMAAAQQETQFHLRSDLVREEA